MIEEPVATQAVGENAVSVPTNVEEVVPAREPSVQTDAETAQPAVAVTTEQVPAEIDPATPKPEAKVETDASIDAFGQTPVQDSTLNPASDVIIADGKDWKTLIDQEETKTEVIPISGQLIDAS